MAIDVKVTSVGGPEIARMLEAGPGAIRYAVMATEAQFGEEVVNRAEAAFLRIRHASDCDGRYDCHKQFKCRNSMLAVNYVCKKAILSYCGGDKQHPLYVQFKHDWPCLSRERRHQIKRQYWIPLCRVAKGQFRFWLD